MTKTILVTGASSGIGKATAKKFQQEGWNVIATMHKPEAEIELTALDNILVIRLDVTDQATIAADVIWTAVTDDTNILRYAAAGGSEQMLANRAALEGATFFEGIKQQLGL